MSKGKLTAIIIASVVLLYSVCAIGLYLIITYLAPQKDVVLTVNTGTLANVTDPDEQFIINVEYYSNHAGNGVEMLEVKFNRYMSDQEINSADPAVYSKGVQIVGDVEGSIQFTSKTVESYAGWYEWWAGDMREYYSFATDNKTYYYDAQNGASATSINKLSDKEMFQISIGEGSKAENYLMKFLGNSTDEKSELNWNGAFLVPVKVYEKYDLGRFLATMLTVCRENNQGYGADYIVPIDLGNMFAYKKMTNGSYSGEWLTSASMMNDKIVQHFVNYFTIRIRTHENGATKASDSMFEMIEGKQDFEVPSNSVKDNYFHGEQVITLTENDFDFMQCEYQRYMLKFKQETVDYIKRSTVKSKVNIVLNNNILVANGINLTENANTGTILKDELYYSVVNKIGKIYVQTTDSNGNVSVREARI